MNKEKIKVGFCVAYDWHFLEYAIPQIYKQADLICLSIDSNRISWTGNKFTFDETAFKNLITKLDPSNKIQIYQDNFYISDLSPMQNEVRQRNKIAEFMQPGGWHIQLDADEYFLDFEEFVNFLQSREYKRPINICCPLFTLFKQLNNGYLLIKNDSYEKQDFIAIATNIPQYEFGRRNGYFNIKTNFGIVHQSWARTSNEILEKINNWGHKEDFDLMNYFDKWEKLNEVNYNEFKNFHPISPAAWESLYLLIAKDIPTLLHDIKKAPPFVIPKSHLKKVNSIWYSRFRTLFSKLFNKK